MRDATPLGMQRVPEDRQRLRWLVALAILAASGLSLLGVVWILASYFSFQCPIKWDRYRHSFFEHDVDRCLANAEIVFESAFNPNTVTTTGAMGLMALQPGTARSLKVEDPFDPRQNIDGGTGTTFATSA